MVVVYYSGGIVSTKTKRVKLQWATATIVVATIGGDQMAGHPETTTVRRLGGRLRQVRDLKQQPLTAVAAAADISPAYLQKLEAGGVKQPSPNVLLQLAKALGMDYGELMRLAGYVVPNDALEAGKRRRNELTHALSSEELTEDEANELAKYLEWYRTRAR
jgi:transcriptional regulator with XRE-family HTH domain